MNIVETETISAWVVANKGLVSEASGSTFLFKTKTLTQVKF